MESRRQILAKSGTVLAGLTSGCMINGGNSQTTTSDAQRTKRHTTFKIPNGTTNNNCPDGYESLEPYWKASGPGPRFGFELTTDKHQAEIGSEISVHFTNVSEGNNTSGVKKKFDIQKKLDDIWITIFSHEEGRGGHLDKAVDHSPGQGFSWNLTFSQEGMSDAFDSVPKYKVCEELSPGIYRFIYWGVSREESHSIPINAVD